MTTTIKQETGLIKVRQYIIDNEGHKVAAIIDMDELKRLAELIEDMADIKAIEDRKNEPGEDYEVYSKKRKPKLSV